MISNEEINQCLSDITPVEVHGFFHFKREDKFAPLGENGINGSKLRQLIYLFNRGKEAGYKGVIAGAVSQSPQHIMVAAVAKMFEMDCILVTGVKDIQKSKVLKLAENYGAKFHHSNVGYAQVLQSQAFKLQKEKHNDYFVVETNITMSEKLNTSLDIKKFHEIGARQVANIPDNVDTLILPCGSCNSATSVMYGIYLYKKENIKNIWLMGIGSYGSKDIDYIKRRLKLIDPIAESIYSDIGDKQNDKITLYYKNLNGEGFCKYEDCMPYNYFGIEFHPRYEGKIMNYLHTENMLGNFRFRRTLFWNIGSEPQF